MTRSEDAFGRSLMPIFILGALLGMALGGVSDLLHWSDAVAYGGAAVIVVALGIAAVSRMPAPRLDP